jgi:hypothetical protein
MSLTCIFCDNNFDYVNGRLRPTKTDYICSRCGYVRLADEETYDDFEGEKFSQDKKTIISIVLRNEYENRNHKPPLKALTLDDLSQIVEQYNRLDPLAKMDNALINIDRSIKYVGGWTKIITGFDYPYYHCFNKDELDTVISLLTEQNLIKLSGQSYPNYDISFSNSGYQRLSKIKKPGKDSRQCFIAMWFTDEMTSVFEKAIKPAIEFVEEGSSIPRFTAVKIDNLEHINDINDEIIAQIRRSRFIVCDLTGYRGGVYFEAGFAYGLGLEVIYTCREDWCKEEMLKDNTGKEVPNLYDSSGRKIEVKKEGVHFDLAHRNRIEWSPHNLDEFRIKLQNRIKSVIV